MNSVNATKMSLNKTGPNSSTVDNEIQFSPQDLNDLAIRLGADLGLPDINDIHVVDETVNSDSLLTNVDQSHVITEEDGQQISGDMETIVIDSIHNDMNDTVVYGNVANEVSISSSTSFEKQSHLVAVNTPVYNKSASVMRRPKSGPSKIRVPNTVQQIRVQNPVATATPTQILPINAINLGQLNTTQILVPQSKPTLKAKATKKPITPNTTNILTNQLDSTSTLKVIYTSQGQQIIFSPQKQANLNSATVVNLANPSVAPAGKVLLKPVTQTVTKTISNIPQNQPQQVIILSPVKAATNVSSLAPTTTKLITGKPQQILAAKSPQRPLAPAPATPKIAISKTMPPPQDIKSVQLIRVVPISSAQAIPQMATTSMASTKMLPLRPIAPNTRPIAPISQSTHKVLVPTSAIKGTPITFSSTNSSLSQTAFLSTSGPTSTGQVFMLPNSSLLKITPTTTNVSSTPSTKSVSFANTSSQRTNFVPIAPSPITTSSASSNPSLTAAQISSLKITNGSTKAEDPHQRKPCNCTKSQCLKLYCDCFANGEFCSSCNCVSCHNNLDHEEDRQKAIRQCLERNPHAFHPKIGKGRAGDTERRHTKGCNCRRSGCLKNYCECYEAKILCSGLCKCVGCKNFEESFERKTLMHLADAAEVRSAQQNVATKNRLWSGDFKPKLPIRVDGDRLPCTFITPEVVEATCQCLLAQAEHGEKSGLNYKGIETLVLEEFGRCLSQIIECANKTRNSKFKQEPI